LLTSTKVQTLTLTSGVADAERRENQSRPPGTGESDVYLLY
jgi:hypothetical protein